MSSDILLKLVRLLSTLFIFIFIFVDCLPYLYFSLSSTFASQPLSVKKLIGLSMCVCMYLCPFLFLTSYQSDLVLLSTSLTSTLPLQHWDLLNLLLNATRCWRCWGSTVAQGSHLCRSRETARTSMYTMLKSRLSSAAYSTEYMIWSTLYHTLDTLSYERALYLLYNIAQYDIMLSLYTIASYCTVIHSMI